MQTYNPISWKNEKLYLLDQRLLPREEVFIEITFYKEAIAAIKDMIVRGAPCIGFTSIYGMALWLKQQKEITLEGCRKVCDEIIAARPTAVNLSFEVNRCFEMIKISLSERKSASEIFSKITQHGHDQIRQSYEKNLLMAKTGVSELLNKMGSRKWRLMTHCNTGFLACGSLGTALGVISHAHELNLVDHVFVDETRPYLQGSRLTSFELQKENIPHSIVVEGASSFLFSQKKVDAIFVGADRIAANGDTANKIGTSSLAIVANYYKIPFYVVAPISSFDLELPHGLSIEIEMRPMNEITHYKDIEFAPKGAQALNPSFDVTDHKLITGIICEKGLINPSVAGDLVRVVNS